MSTKIENVITCPHCDHQYIPAEIYIGDCFLGKSTNVIKDALGKVIYVDYEDGKEPNFREKFICDSCNKPFVVEAQITYRASAEEEALDFSTEYASLL